MCAAETDDFPLVTIAKSKDFLSNFEREQILENAHFDSARNAYVIPATKTGIVHVGLDVRRASKNELVLAKEAMAGKGPKQAWTAEEEAFESNLKFCRTGFYIGATVATVGIAWGGEKLLKASTIDVPDHGAQPMSKAEEQQIGNTILGSTFVLLGLATAAIAYFCKKKYLRLLDDFNETKIQNTDTKKRISDAIARREKQLKNE